MILINSSSVRFSTYFTVLFLPTIAKFDQLLHEGSKQCYVYFNINFVITYKVLRSLREYVIGRGEIHLQSSCQFCSC